MKTGTIPTEPVSEIFVRRPRAALSSLLVSTIVLALACSKSDQSSSDTAASSTSSNAASSAATLSAGTSSGVTAVRGRLVTVTDSALTVSSANGDVSVKVIEPLEVYSRVPAKISQVKENSFVGVTSVAQPDGRLRATEVHIFPEKLRGTNEGSFMMGQRSSGGGSPGNTMTNGTVSGSRMTNGTVAGSRMTNGTVGAQSSGALTVRFQADSQTIAIPSGVPVTAMTLTQTKLAPGMNVVIRATRQTDGTLTSSTVMLGAGPRPAK